MSRFRPDGWRELLGRTFEMADFRGGVYVETIAPDLRPAVLVVAAATAMLLWVLRRRHFGSRHISGCERSGEAGYGSCRVVVAALLAWLVSWGAWLYVSGNGRYALVLLVLVGPLAGAVMWRLPIRNDWRWLALTIVCGAQGVLINSASPSQAWSMMRERWTSTHPFASLQELLEPLAPDLIIATQSQTMAALLVNTPAAKAAHILSLDFAASAGGHSQENLMAVRAMAQAKRPVLFEAYVLDFVDKSDEPRLYWRSTSQQLLARYGLTVDKASCRKAKSPLNTLLVACGLKRTPSTVTEALKPAPLAEASMKRLIELCGGSLWPVGASYVQPDGGLVQVFREARYIVRATIDGSLYVRWRQDVNFRQRWAGGRDPRKWSDIECDAIIRK